MRPSALRTSHLPPAWFSEPVYNLLAPSRFPAVSLLLQRIPDQTEAGRVSPNALLAPIGRPGYANRYRRIGNKDYSIFTIAFHAFFESHPQCITNTAC